MVKALDWVRMVGHPRLGAESAEGRFIGLYHDGRARVLMTHWFRHNVETAPEMLWPVDQLEVLPEPSKRAGKKSMHQNLRPMKHNSRRDGRKVA